MELTDLATDGIGIESQRKCQPLSTALGGMGTLGIE